LSDALRRHVIDGKSRISPLLLQGYSDDAALHLSCARHYVLDRFGTAPQRFGSSAIRRNDKIRLAYLSSDFRRHAVAYLVVELFERHDRTQFEVFGVSLGADDGSDMRTRIMAGFDRFIDVRTQGERDVARLVTDLQVDIAIDLNGHTQDERLGILALRPAPIQVNYLGYPGTSGADFIDYIIADATVLPFDQQPYYTETSFICPTATRRTTPSAASHHARRHAKRLACRRRAWCSAASTIRGKLRRPCSTCGCGC